jgi:hypothetical protein
VPAGLDVRDASRQRRAAAKQRGRSRCRGVVCTRARAEATEANRDGRFDHARQVLEATARRIREYAGDDPKLRHLAEKLVSEEYVFGMPMAVMARKASYYGRCQSIHERPARCSSGSQAMTAMDRGERSYLSGSVLSVALALVARVAFGVEIS